MKTDTIFYQLFQTYPQTFFEIINSPPETVNFYQFSSVEVKQLAFRIDGVFLPNDITQPIYFLEVQFQSDRNFYGRFFSEIFLYLSKTELMNNWYGVIIYPHRGVDTGEIYRYEELLNSGRVSRIYLNELGNKGQSSIGLATIQLVIEQENQAIEQGRELIERVRQELENEQKREELLKLIETILIYKLPKMNRQEIEAMFSLSDLKNTKVYQEALQEGEKRGEQIGEKRGEQRGEKRGEQKGRIAAKLEAVPQLLALGLSVEQIANALNLAVEQVEEISQQN
ncbi:MAG: Rpn family recombination-promoting nuclease/putative transposase [Crocosphaera sp.]